MLKRSVTYKDFDDNMVTETLYFNISPPEIAKLKAQGIFDGLSKMINSKPGDEETALIALEKFISLAYGIRTNNDRSFHKDEQQSQDFLTSPAYGALFTDLLNEGEASAVEFITGIIPEEVRNQLFAQMAGQSAGVKVDIPLPTTPATTQGITVTGIKLAETVKTDDSVPSAFQAKRSVDGASNRARPHGHSGDPRKKGGVMTPEEPEESAVPKPLNEMTEEELRAELASRRSN